MVSDLSRSRVFWIFLWNLMKSKSRCITSTKHAHANTREEIGNEYYLLELQFTSGVELIFWA